MSWRQLTSFRIALLLGLLLSALRFAGCHYLELVDVRAVDYRLLQRGAQPATPQVMIVAIDDASLARIGRWPWSRALVARLVERLTAAGAAVVGFDIVESEATVAPQLEGLRERLRDIDDHTWVELQQALQAGSPEDAQLTAAVRGSGHTVLGYFFDFERHAEAEPPIAVSSYNSVRRHGSGPTKLRRAPRARGNLPELAAAARELGYFNFFPDADGSYRRVPLAIEYEEQVALPLSLAMLRAQQPDQQFVLRLDGPAVDAIFVGAESVPVAADGQMLINFRGPKHTFRHIPAADVLQGRIDPAIFQGKLLLVGVTAPALADVRVTPFDSTLPGVEIHANILDNILRHDFLMQPWWTTLVEIGVILLSVAVLGAALHYARGVSGALVAIVMLTAYLVGSQWAFLTYGLPLSLVYPLLAIALTYSAIGVQHYVVEEGEKRKIRNAFSLHVNPALAELVSERPEMLKLGGDKRDLTVLFSDIRGFTSISEGLEPEMLVAWLNEFLGDMTDVIFAHDGTLDKYIGDAIMAVWGAPVPQPDHAARACRAALGMVECLHRVSAEWQRAGRPAIDIGIGLNTGAMVVGNMGSARRLSYTVIGDNVNLGSRLEGLNKQYGTRIIASEATLREADGIVVARELDLVRVKGKRLPVRIFEIVAPAEDGAEWRPMVEQFDAGIAAYRTQRWTEARAAFETLLAQRPGDGPTRLYLKRVQELQAHPPPPDWDGVTIMETK